MFKAAILRLTGMYLAILVVICLFFSANWYAIASRELDRGSKKQDEWLQINPRALGPNLIQDFLRVRNEQLLRSKQAVVFRIFMSNLGLILIGTLGSYYLARRTLEPIEEAHNAQVRFTGDASHELRTPLAAMRTETEVTLRDKALTKQQAIQQLQSNLVEVKRLQSLTDNLLLLARNPIDSPLEVQPVKLNEVISQAIDRAQAAAQSRKISLVKKVQPKLIIRGNQDVVGAILDILLDNALKYSPKNTVVNIAAKPAVKRMVAVTIADQGIGINEQDQYRVFERFYRVDQSRTKQKIEGHGLGLAIARDLTEQLGGTIQVTSKVGKGSRFTVLLPATH